MNLESNTPFEIHKHSLCFYFITNQKLTYAKTVSHFIIYVKVAVSCKNREIFKHNINDLKSTFL